MSNIREHAKGRWPEIVSALIGDRYADTRKHLPCPATGEGRDRFRLSDRNGTGNFFCACSQGEKDGIELIRCVYGCDYRRAIELVESVIGPAPRDERREKAQPTRAERIWPTVERSRRSRYLAGRGLEVPPGVRWHRSLAYYDGDGRHVGDYPAMVAPVIRGDQLLTLHVTYLQDGDKAPLDPPRKLLPARQPLGGGAVPLYRRGPTLGIAEGIETAIAARMLYGWPTWAALNTTLLEQFEPPEGVERVIVYGDHDSNLAGHAAAYRLAHRLILRGYEVQIAIPQTPDTDWADVLLGSKEAA